LNRLMEELKLTSDGEVVFQSRDKPLSNANFKEQPAQMIPVVERQFKRVSMAPAPSQGSYSTVEVAKRNEKQMVIGKLRQQNEKLKAELAMLTNKLEVFIEKSRKRKHKQMFGVAGHDLSQKDEQILIKEGELRQAQAKTQYYKWEIENMRRQLEGSYNIQKIVALEDEQKNKERILKALQDESETLLKVQREQEKALEKLNKHGDYDQKIGELGTELRTAKE